MNARPWYPANGRELLEARRKGMVPDGRVVVSLVGGQFGDVAAATLHARPDMPVERLDWRMLVNLEVWLWAGPGAALGWVLATTSRIAHARPRGLVLRFEEGSQQIHDVDVGTGFHAQAIREIPATHEFVWYPLDLSRTTVAGKLRKALAATHKPWTRL